jgi:phosphoserine aminotransferase
LYLKITNIKVTKQSLNTLFASFSLTDVPSEDTWKLTKDPSYFYYCANETIHGIELDDIPSIIPEDVPIVCDMSSNFLTRSFDVTRVMQKNNLNNIQKLIFS